LIENKKNYFLLISFIENINEENKQTVLLFHEMIIKLKQKYFLDESLFL
jgi:hypothetical protein